MGERRQKLVLAAIGRRERGLRLHDLVDLSAASDPASNAAVRITDRHRSRQKPAIGAVGRAQAITAFEELWRSDRRLPFPIGAFSIIWMQGFGPAAAHRIRFRHPRIGAPRVAHEGVQAFRIGFPKEARNRLRQNAKPFLALPQRRLGSYSLGNVSCDSDEADDIARGVAVRRFVTTEATFPIWGDKRGR